MKKSYLFFLCFIVGLANAAFAQATKTVTNADLEKFRQERVRAEEDWRVNYRKLGFASPEELQKIRAQRQTELEQLAIRLREEELQKQIAEAQWQNAVRAQNGYVIVRTEGSQYYSNGFYTSGFYYQPYYVNRRFVRRNYNQPNYPIGGGYAFPSAFDNRRNFFPVKPIITPRPR
jgi:hypothetical protein